ncbi:Protein of unknown function [Lactobacillus delbrueckii subsp. lactis]|nr:Protein of unknown function [Lactobacillus delbrueckii subsp. lactis]CDR80657.1 Protein of unknown function [Lactobacillus delbrueckii subsp. lactis]
MRSEMMKMIGQ